jgi:twitching motility protein PilT
MSPEQKQIFDQQKELDFSYEMKKNRFRVNAYTQQGSAAAAIRYIPQNIRSIDELQLPQVFHDITKLKQGLVLLTGPTGEGKSTSLAAIIHEINQTRANHIVTIEDPIEFVYQPIQSIVSQREVHYDTLHWDVALRSVLREDPDVVLIGEMRDLETIAAALTIDVFPEHQQEQIRQQLAATLAAVFSQRLIPTKQDSRVVAVEILLASIAVKNLIREKKTFQIDNVLQTSADQGMITLEASLANWVKAGIVTQETAMAFALRPTELERMLKA